MPLPKPTVEADPKAQLEKAKKKTMAKSPEDVVKNIMR
jgi:hypothetical protein